MINKIDLNIKNICIFKLIMNILRIIKKTNLQPKLGRWGVTYEENVLEKRINWANHDHCGSEVCERLYSEKEINKDKKREKEIKDWEKYIKEKKEKEKSNLLKEEKVIDYYLPYCL